MPAVSSVQRLAKDDPYPLDDDVAHLWTQQLLIDRQVLGPGSLFLCRHDRLRLCRQHRQLLLKVVHLLLEVVGLLPERLSRSPCPCARR